MSQGDLSTRVEYANEYFYPEEVELANDAGNMSFSQSGFTGGAQLGYNFQHDDLVFGLEADLAYPGINASEKDSRTYPCCAPSSFTLKQDLSVGWLGTARAKLGFASGKALFYGTGGLAFGNVSYQSDFSDDYENGAVSSSSSSEVKLGWSAGGGVEWMMTESVSLKLEYLYYDLGDVSAASGAFRSGGRDYDVKFDRSASVSGSIVRAGLNWHFN